MRNLSRQEKKILNEIEQIKNIMYGYDRELNSNDREWRDIRPVRLQIERDNLIRAHVIHQHLWIDEFLNSMISDYFLRLKSRRRSKRYRIFDNFVRDRLDFSEKVNLVKQIEKIPKGILGRIWEVDTLRNGIAHYYFPEIRPKKVGYKGKNIFDVNVFKQFVEDMREVSKFIIDELFFKIRR
jgi:hypothetical protein